MNPPADKHADKKSARGKRPTRAALRRELRLLARDFADQLVTVLDRHSMWDDAAIAIDDADLPARIRRSTLDLEKVKARILDDLRTRKEPVSIGKVAATLGLSSRQVAHPMSLLVDQGTVLKSGERRGARYEVAPHRTPKRVTRRPPKPPPRRRGADRAETERRRGADRAETERRKR